MIKPVVHYKGFPRFSIWPWFVDDNGNDIIVGHLPEVVDHPRLGHKYDVRTSDVIVPMDDSGKFETLYTIYEPYQNS
jgi:hypothetical protein